jgi:hypothetical protein
MTEQEEKDLVSNNLVAIVNRVTPLIKKKVMDSFEVTFEFEGRKYTLGLKQHFSVRHLFKF